MDNRTQKSDVRIRRYEAGIVVALTLPLWPVAYWLGGSLNGFSIELERLVESGIGGTLLLFAAILCLSLVCAWLVARKLDTTIAIALLGTAVVIGVWKFQSIMHEQLEDAQMYSFKTSFNIRQAISRKQNQTSSKKWDAPIKDLINVARLKGYEVSPEWCDAFLNFGREGLYALKPLVSQEPEVSGLLDDLAKHRYGIVDDMTSKQAWDVLMRIAEESKEGGAYFVGSSWAFGYTSFIKHEVEVVFNYRCRAVKLIASQLDHQQVCDTLTAAVERGHWPCRTNNKDEISLLSLRPVLHAAVEIDRQLNRDAPDQYNLLERQVGDALFSQSRPQATPYFYSDLIKLLENTEQPLAHLGVRPLRLAEFKPPMFGSPKADEYVRRQAQSKGVKVVNHAFGDEHLFSKLAVQTGVSLRVFDGANFGNTKTNRWYEALIRMDSPVGREFRRTHRKELIELAIRSIGHVEKKEQKKGKDPNRALNSALASIFSDGRSPEPWPMLPQLEFLFLDLPGTTAEPSLAKEFWPFFDASLDTLPDAKPPYRSHELSQRLRLRWSYLARIWPESDEESFIDAYLKAPSLARQHVLNNRLVADRGLPDLLPVDVRLKILRRLQTRLAALPDSAKEKYRFLFGSSRGLITEEQSVQRTIAALDCPEGAAAYIDWNVESFGPDKLRTGPFSPSSSELWRVNAWVHELGDPARVLPCEWFARDDRFDLFASHDNVVLRYAAVILIRQLPKPRFLRALPKLVDDVDPQVSAAAKQVKDELDELLNTDLATFSKSIQK